MLSYSGRKRVGCAGRERLSSGFAFFLSELCQGPPRGARITLARPDQWIDGWREVTDEDEALREVCRRFLRTYGPARPADFCEWFSSAAFKVADAIAFLYQGKLVAQGSPKEMRKATHPKVHEFLSTWFGKNE